MNRNHFLGDDKSALQIKMQSDLRVLQTEQNNQRIHIRLIPFEIQHFF